MAAPSGPGSHVGPGLLARDDAFRRHHPGVSPAQSARAIVPAT